MTAKHGDVWQSPCGAMELRCGNYRDALADVECDAVITDPPFSVRTHAGQRTADTLDGASRRDLTYAAWASGDVVALFASLRESVGWVVALSDHGRARDYELAAAAVGRYGFAPLPWLAPGSRCRLVGDGPSSWTTWINVSRPRREPWSKWGTLPGGYVIPSDRGGHIGGKPLALIRALVLDYSRPGDLVCDPCAGGGTTLLAAAMEGRRAIGAELDPSTFELAVKRLAKGYTAPMRFETGDTRGEQSRLFGGDR